VIAVGPSSEFSRRITSALLHNHNVRSRSFVEFDVVGDLFDRRLRQRPDAICHVLSYKLAVNQSRNPPAQHHDVIALIMRSVIQLSTVAEMLEVPLVHVSDDSIFAGRLLTHDDWTEDTEPYPTDWSGQLHLWAEHLVRSICPNAVIIRLSPMFGFQEDRVRDRVGRQLFVGTAASAIADITAHASNAPKLIHVTNDSPPSAYHDIGYRQMRKDADPTYRKEPHQYAGLKASPGFLTLPLNVDLDREKIEQHNSKVWGSWRTRETETIRRLEPSPWEHAPDERPF
jgi:dTDP-4-dehydrorhamnose reductase